MKKSTKPTRQIYVNAILVALGIENILNVIQYHTIWNFAVLFGIIGLFMVSLKKTIPLIREGHTAGLKEPYAGYYRDKFCKRINNLGYLFIYVFWTLPVNLYLAIASGSAKTGEILTAIRPTLDNLVLIFLFLYAAVLQLVNLGSDTEESGFKKYIIRQFSLASGAWAAYFAVALIGGIECIYRTFSPASVCYLVLVMIGNLTIRRQVTTVNFRWRKRNTAIILSALLVIGGIHYMRRDTFYLQEYINTVPRISQNTAPITYRENDGVYEIRMEKEEFRILQLTDIHFGGSITSIRKDYKALDAVYALIKETRPDLVVVTGDMTFPLGIMSMSFNNSSAVNQFAAFMRNLNIPWAFTFGNHDTDAIASMDRESLCDLYESLSFRTSGTLLYPYTQPNITGRNNQLIELYNPDGSLNQALFLIDSNAYTGEGINVYDYIHDDQVDWYETQVTRLNNQEEKTVSSMAFFHIPLQEYRDAYDLYMGGSDEVTYFFGSNDEKMINKVCCSDYPSSLFDRMVELGSTKAVFCGHDHYNHMSLEYKGIRLTYGMSIDYLAMPGIEKSSRQRGGTLITIHSDTDYTIQQIPLDSIDNSANH